ncbi:DUF3592 domain-containing protein [Brachybacterium hainanense]|uniref:DUF3592 domain-containing protein n=1 Tax=Brachybacterium hainanense TaxID=1541174 RepID=A0ABV6R685_9MICO
MFEHFSILFMAVPLLIIAIALVTALRAVRRLLQALSLTSRGARTTGTVISSNLQVTSHSSGSSGSRTTRALVETIEFRTRDGQRVRAIPAVSDVGMLDRTGMEVEVCYDEQRPDRFIAPKDGGSPNLLRLAGPILSAVVMIGFALFFLWFSRGILGFQAMM